jgi:phage terminase large subunit-like protein
MPARKKTHRQFVADGTWLKRRHAQFLDDEAPIGDPVLDRIQRDYQDAKDGLDREELALSYQRAVKDRAAARREMGEDELQARLRKLGPPGSARQVIRFFPEFFRWDDDSPFLLDPFQQSIIREAYRRDKQGRRIYKLIILEIPRGNGKTPLASGIGLHTLLTQPGRPKVFQAAGSGEQAGIGLEYAQTWVESSDLVDYLRPNARGLKRVDGRGSYLIMPAAGGLGHGRKPNAGIVDEWWLFEHYAQTQTFVSLESALFKLPDSFLFAIGTAGYDKTSQAGGYHEKAMKAPYVRTSRRGFLTISKDEEAGTLFIRYGMPDGYELDLEDDAAVLRAIALANPGSWVDHRELLRALRRTDDVYEWLRLNLNAWTRAKGSWLKVGAWQGLLDAELEIPAGAEIFVAVDAAHSYDTTAVTWAWRAPDGRIVLRTRVFSVRPQAPAHKYVDEFYNPATNEHVAEAFIQRELAATYRVREVVGDPNYFGNELKRLGQRFATAEIYPNSKWMRAYVQAFYKAVHETKLIAHDGDRVVREHVGAIAATKDGDGKWVIRQLKQSNPIDAGTSQIIAHGRADRHAPGESDFDIFFLSDLDEDVDGEEGE